MRYTPVELRHVKVSRGLFGYARHEVEKLLEDVADSYEEVWGERGELADKLEDLEKLLEDVKQREQLLTSALVAAERAALEAKDAAKREAELIVAEAHQEARSITRGAQTERERLFGEARRIETLLRAALGMVEEGRAGETAAPAPVEPEPPAASVAPLREHWPQREDTREFTAVPVPREHDVPLPPVTEEGDDGPWQARDFAWG